MLEQELRALSAACGASLVDAVGTDAWTGLRQAVAGWFAQGDAQRERVERDRLDQIAGELQTAEATEKEEVSVSLKAVWQTRIETLLSSLDDTERTLAVTRLRCLLLQHALSTITLPSRPPLQVDPQMLTFFGELRSRPEAD
ncbi:hypothetical protein CG747_10360 [Streptomyces sp. CB02959]|uniref:hypothetical protein n=1 Tax=Streptomyces sp. CB02959 TaxID=2020330 RepID=UPI000C26DE2D|nr:hypothetical protein [Streptomyces sp. CB02959]PJN40735.1 hypothetical protein CG747_10360 [Streptomyces sp. CB02959]